LISRPAYFTKARPAGRWIWDVVLGLGVLGYLALVLFDDVESPLLAMALIVLVAYELVQSHRGRR
jgi:hypothetical protein